MSDESVRVKIRKGYKELLKSTFPGVAGRVFDHRRPRLSKADLPCLSVHLGDSAMRAVTQSFPRTMENRIELVIAAYADESRDDLDDELDAMSADIERVLTRYWKLGGLVKSLTPTRVRMPDPQNPDHSMGVALSYFEVVFFTVEGHPELNR